MPVARFQMPDGRIGRFEVPEGTSPEDAQAMIHAHIGQGDQQPAPRPAAASRPPVTVDSPLKQGLTAPFAPAEAAANLASSFFAKPISDVAGLAAIPMHAMGMDRDPAKVRDQVAESLTYQPRTTQGQMASQYNPLALIGRLFSGAGDMAEHAVAPPTTSGPAQSALGSGVGEAVRQLPTFAGVGMGRAAAPVKNAARTTMQSALKPTWADLRTGKADRAVDTMLNDGVNVSRGGVDVLRAAVDDLNRQIGDKIATSNATIDKTAATAPLDGTLSLFSRQVNPNSDVAAIRSAKDEFMNHPSLPRVTPAHTVESPILDSGGRPFTTEIPESGTNRVPVQTAQELKQGTYRAIGNKSYGELKGAEVEAQKALARGLKDEVATAVPEVRALNAKESELLNALPIVERRVLMDANKNPAGLGLLVKHPGAFAAWMADRSPGFKSIVARMLNQTSEALPAAPAIGALVDGYRFKGGDHRDQSAWEAQ